MPCGQPTAPARPAPCYTVTGQRHDTSAARNQLRRLLAAAGLDQRASPYGLRVSFIIACLEAEISERVTAAYVGHSTIAVIAHYDRMRSTVATRLAVGTRLSTWFATQAGRAHHSTRTGIDDLLRWYHVRLKCHRERTHADPRVDLVDRDHHLQLEESPLRIRARRVRKTVNDS